MSEYEKTKIVNCKCGNYFLGNNDNELCDNCQLKHEVKKIFLEIVEMLKLDKFINWLERMINK
jgi:hypothetical protein